MQRLRGGGGEGHLEPLNTQAVKWNGRTHAVDLTLSGMSAMIFLFKPAPVEKGEEATAA
jgi:hypothetical protein